ncbi:MAG: hypothetical protein PHS14_18360 [Elusimicrobia bacterium]|nr:hypothetical protein [Elusimicrobiota bacterium]
MAQQELPPQTGERMIRHGAVVIFGPDYLENSLQLLKEMKEALTSTVVLSCEKIDDLAIPSGPVLNCTMIFFHRKPSHMDAGAWDTALLKGADLSSRPPKGLGVADQSPEEPKVELVPAGGDEMQLILAWLRPLESSHIVQAARAIERAYLENGGSYSPR